MEDQMEPLIKKVSKNQENQKEIPHNSNIKDVTSFNVEMEYSSDFSQESTSCLYKCFYPIILILYYLLCWCWCAKGYNENPRLIVAKRFKKWIKKRGERKHDPFDVLLKLYAKEDRIVEELEKVRLNPDFTSIYRNDLEFYLPQLCSYCLYEDENNEIKNFIVLAAQSNIFFLHRVLFFIESLQSED